MYEKRGSLGIRVRITVTVRHLIGEPDRCQSLVRISIMVKLKLALTLTLNLNQTLTLIGGQVRLGASHDNKCETRKAGATRVGWTRTQQR